MTGIDRFWPVALCHRLIIDLKRGGFSLDPRPVWHWTACTSVPHSAVFIHIKYGVSSDWALNTLLHSWSELFLLQTSRGKEIESLKASDLFLVTLSQDYNTPQNTLHPTSSRAAVISVLSLPLFFWFVYEDRQPLLWTAGPPPRLVLGIFRTLYAISMLFFETT